MAKRIVGKLTALAVSRASKRGLYGDGGGLYLRVAPGGAKGWVFRFMLRGRARTMGLGGLDAVPLKRARQRAAECRGLVAEGVDPVEARRAERAGRRLADARNVTFRKAAETYIASHAAGWRNTKHAKQWSATLEAYAFPTFGDLPVADIDVALVLKVLEPIWTAKPETASRVRGRIESILDWAKARGFREGDNPARWRGHLAELLPARRKVKPVEHHPAMPYTNMFAFMAALRVRDGSAARALEFGILTAARTSEAIGATWGEIDMAGKVWNVPGSRMKSGRPHRVPLSQAALDVLAKMAEVREADGPDAFVFPSGARRGRPLSGMALLMLLRRMGRADIVPHGFRSSFRDWAGERTAYPREVAEAALAHVIDNKAEAAYRRGDALDKRRAMMESWAEWCTTPPPRESADVVAIGARAGA